MADSSSIEWTDSTWNPTTGCDKVSPGCDNCYAMTLAPRLKAMGSAHYQTDGDPRTSGPGFGIAMHTDALDKPLRWTRPRRIFVNSMSDLFHPGVTREFQAQVFAVMALAPQHTFQVLTKRPGVMRSVVSSHAFRVAVLDSAYLMAVGEHPNLTLSKATAQEYQERVTVALNLMTVPGVEVESALPWPLPNVWLGTSVEDQKRADLRIPALLGTPAAVRFLSCEPLLDALTFRWAKWHPWVNSSHLDGLKGIDWVIVGGESGRGARPMRAAVVRSLRDECVEADVAFHFKQWGSHDEHGTPMHKKLAGRLLDGRTWDEFPEAVA